MSEKGKCIMKGNDVKWSGIVNPLRNAVKNPAARTVFVFIAVLMFLFFMTSCGNIIDENSSDGEASGKFTADQTKIMNRDEYIDRVIYLSDEISEITDRYSVDLDSDDTAIVTEATREMIGEMKPVYVQLGQLPAPEEFSSQQERIKEGCDASVEALDLSLELLDLGQGNTQGEDNAQKVTDKIKELSTKMIELEDQASGLTTAITEVRLS